VAKKILAVHQIGSSPPAKGAKNFVGPLRFVKSEAVSCKVADALHTHHKGNSNTLVNTVAKAEVYPEVNAIARGSGHPATGHGGGRGGSSRGSGRGSRSQVVESGVSRQAW
jgi:hypothetical protein